MKQDAYKKVYPIKIEYQDKELASADKMQAFQKMTERAFAEIERAIGDIYNTENAQNSVLSSDRLYINSLGRSLGSMSNIEPILSGINEYSPALALNMDGATYNVIPHPNQTIKLEVGCKYDMTASPTATTRSCIKGQDAFYRKVQGSNTGICQNASCPFWSARDGRQITVSDCQTDTNAQTFREYKLVVPTESRIVTIPRVVFYSNCGAVYDKYRNDQGATGYTSPISAPGNTWALATNGSIAVSGISEEIKYVYPGLTSSSTYNAVIEIPPLETNQIISVNNVALATVAGTSAQPTRYFLNLSAFTNLTELRINIKPENTSPGTIAAVSQIWIVENKLEAHRNTGQRLLLPAILDNLSAGTEIPPNFLQIYDTNSQVNRILDNTKVFATRFNPLSASLNNSSNRDAFDVTIFGNQKLEVGNTRYLGVTVGFSVTKAVRALMEAFAEHVSDRSIHLTRSQICELLSDKTYCCDDRLKFEIDELIPANKVALTAPATYRIKTFIYGGFAPYTVTINWGDNVSDANVAPPIVSGVQVFDISSDVRPPTSVEFSHTYNAGGSYNVTMTLLDDPDVFGCSASLTSLVSPFNVGNPPEIDSEVRLDYSTSYPSFGYIDIEEGYPFTYTSAADWSTNPTWHVLTQVNNSDPESGKPVEFDWSFANSNGLTFGIQREDVSGVYNEALSFVNNSGVLTNNFIQQNSIVLKKGNTVFEYNVDYTVNWASGIIEILGNSIGANETGFTVSYHHYPNAISVSGIANQWILLVDEVSDTNIQLSTYTSRKDVNTIRIKIRE